VRRVLFVDDDKMVLDGLKKALRAWRADLTLETAQGGASGIERLRQQHYDAVVTDARMPGIDGERVLLAVQEYQPNAVRMILSGQVDRGSSMRLACVAHQYLAKPCEPALLVAAIEHCCRSLEAIADPKLRSLATQLSFIPLRRESHSRLTYLIGQPDVTAETLSATSESSPLFSAAVLRLANSPLFGAPRLATVSEAITLLGVDVVRELLKVTPIYDFQISSSLLAALRRRAFIRIALTKKMLEPPGAPHWALDAVVLCDVALGVLLLYQPEWAEGLVNATGRSDGAQLLTELERQSSHYLALGPSLLTLWNVPPTIVGAVSPVPSDRVQSCSGRNLVSLALALEQQSRPGGAPDDDRLRQTDEVARLSGYVDTWASLRALAARLQASTIF
jgi:CheY-like chemotaxis protein